MTVHEALNHCVVVAFQLPPPGQDEVGANLGPLPRRAATELPLFEPVAVEAIFQGTQVLPRRIDLVAHHSPIGAAPQKAKLATVDHVQAGLTEVS